MSVALNFNEKMYKMRHPVFASYAGAGDKLLSEYNINGEWLNYFNSVGKLFGVNASELAGYVSSEFVLGDIKKAGGKFVVENKVEYLCDFIKGLSYLADKISKLPASSVDNPRFKLLLEDMPGQKKFDMLKEMVRNSAYSMILTSEDDANGAMRDFTNIQITMFTKSFGFNHHTSAVVIPFLDKLVDINDPELTAVNLFKHYSNSDFESGSDPDSLVNRLNMIYEPSVIDERINDCINDLVNWADVKSMFNKDYAKDVIVEKLSSLKPYRRGELDVNNGADELVKAVNSVNDWSGYLALSDENRLTIKKVVASVTSSSKYDCPVDQSINGSLERLLSFVDFKSDVISKKIVKANFVAYLPSSAMPSLGFYNIEFNHIAFAGLLDFNPDGSAFMSNPVAVLIGPGSIGKTQNKTANEYFLDNSKNWLDSGKMSTSISYLDLPLFKEMFYSKWDGVSSVKDFKTVTQVFNNTELQMLSTKDEPLNLELVSRLRAFVLPGSVNLTDVLPRRYSPAPESLINKKKSWIDYASVRINDCNSLDDFKKFFGIDKSFVSDYQAKITDWNKGCEDFAKKTVELEKTKAGDELNRAKDNLSLAFRIKHGDNTPESLSDYLSSRLCLPPESINNFIDRAKNDFI